MIMRVLYQQTKSIFKNSTTLILLLLATPPLRTSSKFREIRILLHPRILIKRHVLMRQKKGSRRQRKPVKWGGHKKYRRILKAREKTPPHQRNRCMKMMMSAHIRTQSSERDLTWWWLNLSSSSSLSPSLYLLHLMRMLGTILRRGAHIP